MTSTPLRVPAPMVESTRPRIRKVSTVIASAIAGAALFVWCMVESVWQVCIRGGK